MGKPRRDIASLEAREGSECIFYESGLFIHAYLKDVLTNFWGIQFDLDPIPTVGLLQPNLRPGYFGVNWNNFDESDRYWASSAQGVRWWVFFGEDFIQAIIARASQLSYELEPMDRMKELIKVLKDYHWGRGFDGQRAER